MLEITGEIIDTAFDQKRDLERLSDKNNPRTKKWKETRKHESESKKKKIEKQGFINNEETRIVS